MKNHPILIKFGTLMQILNPMTVTWPKTKFCMRKQTGMSTRATWQKLQLYKIQDGWRPPFLKSLNRHISVKNRQILMKFGTLHQILNEITVTRPKMEIFKIQNGCGRYLENRFFGHNSLTDCPISAKFCMRPLRGICPLGKFLPKIQNFRDF